jgi:aerobic-type carbon monoxide dehydrogenase small subunit (CoxS/CutS family)
MKRVLELTINQRAVRVETDPDRMLLGVLRDELDLTGTKYGCGEGRCGACTVLVDGEAVRSCLARVGTVAGKAITTIEGLEGVDGEIHPVQRAFLEEGAFQCGFCTPGMIVAAAGLLASEKAPSTERIVEAMQGNICRCGTYPRIKAAIERAVATRKGGV